jgi:hypothetical protein
MFGFDAMCFSFKGYRLFVTSEESLERARPEIVAVDVPELEWLVIDQEKEPVFRCKKGVQAHFRECLHDLCASRDACALPLAKITART